MRSCFRGLCGQCALSSSSESAASPAATCLCIRKAPSKCRASATTVLTGMPSTESGSVAETVTSTALKTCRYKSSAASHLSAWCAFIPVCKSFCKPCICFLFASTAASSALAARPSSAFCSSTDFLFATVPPGDAGISTWDWASVSSSSPWSSRPEKISSPKRRLASFTASSPEHPLLLTLVSISRPESLALRAAAVAFSSETAEDDASDVPAVVADS
mmetsp:Transcript_45069/g.107096  ORF Transcript_45069/g.107096 Transcript_45069/m.107096 type:complete len:218 (+) Transcript_45069:1298-1951(+)